MAASELTATRKAGGADDTAAGKSGGAQTQYLTFLLGDEMFAIDISGIREIIEYGRLTEVPTAPPFVRGVLNLRGAVLPIIDLAIRFGREPRASTKRTCVVVVDVEAPDGRRQLGVVVDAVSEVLDIPADDVERAPEFGSRLRRDFVLGLARVKERFIVILDPNRVLSMEEIPVAAAIAGEGS